MSKRILRILVLSDLHLEMNSEFQRCDKPFDVVVLAGDIHSPGHKGVEWALRQEFFNGRPVVYVPGNHEFYHRHIDDQLEAMERIAEGTNVHVLNRSSVMVAGVRFLGCILWTDFLLPFVASGTRATADVARAMERADRSLNDFALIRYGPAILRADDSFVDRRFQAADSLALHWIDRDWLQRQLRSSVEATVVVTHHAPSASSIAAKYKGDGLSPAFASPLPGSMFRKPQLWIHGHTHSSADYQRGSCRVISNPRGYRRGAFRYENGLFDKDCVVTVEYDDLTASAETGPDGPGGQAS